MFYSCTVWMNCDFFGCKWFGRRSWPVHLRTMVFYRDLTGYFSLLPDFVAGKAFLSISFVFQREPLTRNGLIPAKNDFLSEVISDWLCIHLCRDQFFEEHIRDLFRSVDCHIEVCLVVPVSFVLEINLEVGIQDCDNSECRD